MKDEKAKLAKVSDAEVKSLEQKRGAANRDFKGLAGEQDKQRQQSKTESALIDREIADN